MNGLRILWMKMSQKISDNEDMDDDADVESMDLFEPAVTVCDYKKNQLLWKNW
ncbi:MAG: hypothetical protein ACLTC8_01940 [Lachnospiraceae bacterium]